MKKLYSSEIFELVNNEDIEYFAKILEVVKEAKDKFSYDNYNILALLVIDYARKRLMLSNQLLALSVNEDKSKVFVAVFPKESDGKHYSVFQDEETKRPYILMEE